MLNIVCVNVGNYLGRGQDYVDRLRAAVERNVSVPYRFRAFGDELPARGWWAKLALFQPGLFEDGDRVLYFDLDTLILEPVDDIASWDVEFATLGAFRPPDRLQSGVMTWRAGFGARFWTEWLRQGRPLPGGGDQEWLEWLAGPRVPRFQGRFPGAFVSYKYHCRPDPPKGARIVCFHGHPRPHEAGRAWVKAAWTTETTCP